MPGKLAKNDYLCYNRKLDLMKQLMVIAILIIVSYAIIHGIISYLIYYNNDMNNVIHLGKDNSGYYIIYKVK